MPHRILLVSMAILLGTLSAHASTAIVPDDFVTIQGAIDSASVDTVLVREGSYPELIRIHSAVVLRALTAGDPARTAVQGLSVEIDETSEPLRIEGLSFHRRTLIRSSSNGQDGFWLVGCVLDSSVTGAGETAVIVLRHCVVNGDVTLNAIGGVAVQNNTIRGSLSLGSNGDASVTGNLLVGRGTGVGIRIGGIGAGYQIAGNRVEGFAVGVEAIGQDNSEIRDNVVLDCPEGGIRVPEGAMRFLEITANRIEHCGPGIYAAGAMFLTAAGNTVLSCSGIAMDLNGSDQSIARGNVVGRCTGDGIRIDQSSTYPTLYERNTVFLCGGAGYLWHPGSAVELRQNIAYGNTGLAFSGRTSEETVFSCNDGFGNLGGNGGASYSVDPLFCDLNANDVSLRANSPLLAASGCDTIGAKGIGCDATTEVQVALLMAESSEDGVRIRWNLGDDERAQSVWIERSVGKGGPWAMISTDRVVDGDATVDWDRSAQATHDYWYRLGWRLRDEEGHSAAIEARAVVVAAFGIDEVAPNPTRADAVIRYSLRRSSRVELTVHDIMGREVARLVSGSEARGNHVVSWSGTKAAPGLYFVRLRLDGSEDTRRIVVSH